MGDISKCFDNIDHGILLKRLYHIGIRDRRVLQIVKAMLRAGIMDEWVAKRWEKKKTQRTYRIEGTKRKSLYQTSLAPGWLIRYADDFVIITDTAPMPNNGKPDCKHFCETNSS